MMFSRRCDSPWTLLCLLVICVQSFMQSFSTNHDQTAVVDYTVLKVDFHYNITDGTGQFLPTTSTYTLKYSQLLRGNWHTSVIQDLSRDVSFNPNESQLVIDYITKEMTRLGFHPHVIDHQQPIAAAELGMDVQAWIATTSTSTSTSPPLPGQDSIIIDNRDGQLIHSDEAIERVLHAATNANYRRLLADGYVGSARSAASTSTASSKSPPPAAASPSSSPSIIFSSESQHSPPRLLFTSRIERGSHSNPLDDARSVLAEHRTMPLSSQSSGGEEEKQCRDVDEENDVDNNDDGEDLVDYVPWNQPSVLPAYILRRNHGHNHTDSDSSSERHYAPRIIIYQTRGVYTGGTVALYLLAERLEVLGYNVLVCEDHNRLSESCAQPSNNDVAITGEWCHEVIADYLETSGTTPSAGSESNNDKTNNSSNTRYEGHTLRGYDTASLFPGRGIQYHLGFHQHADTCRGHITLTDSHFLQVMMSERVLGAYYLGCAMTERFKTSLAEQLNAVSSTPNKRPTARGSTRTRASDRSCAKDRADTTASTIDNQPQHTSVPTSTPVQKSVQNSLSVSPLRVVKEDLVVVDGDLTDYPTEHILDIGTPEGVRVVVARGMTGDQMKLLLLRAKVCLDLAMPGPERLSGECALSGGIAIVSNRWNGASSVDFPGLIRVDHQNDSAVADAVARAWQSYHRPLSPPPAATVRQAPMVPSSEPWLRPPTRWLNDHQASGGPREPASGPGQEQEQEVARIDHASSSGSFLAYIMSMWRRVHHTTDVLFASSHLHFVLHASTLAQEHLTNFQILALLYLFPLASIDVYVPDVKWYIRHHYAFFSSLKRAGYIRFDPLDPQDMTHTARMWSDPLHSDYRIHSDNNKDSNVLSPMSRINIRNEGILRQPLSKSMSESSSESFFLRDTVLSPPWDPIIIFMPSLSSQSDTPVFAEPFALLDMINQSLSTDGDILVVALEPRLEPGHASGQGLEYSNKVVVASPGASMVVVREVVLAAQGLVLRPDQSQGPGQDFHERIKKEGKVSRASLPAHQWRSVCAMLQLHHRHSSHLWDEGEASLPALVDGVTSTTPWTTARSFVQDLRIIADMLC